MRLTHHLRMIRYGLKDHPGTPILVGFAVLGGVAGAERGFTWSICGAGIMLAIFGPMYLFGAWESGRHTPLGFDERERIKQESAGVELGAGGKWLAERERLGGGK